MFQVTERLLLQLPSLSWELWGPKVPVKINGEFTEDMERFAEDQDLLSSFFWKRLSWFVYDIRRNKVSEGNTFTIN